MRNIILIVVLVNASSLAFGQIWKETFDELPNGTVTDNGSTAWSTVAPSTFQTFSKQTYSIYKIFAINDTGGEEGIWRSEPIDISSSPEVAIEITLGSYWASNSDYIRCYYKINGGLEVLFGEQFGATDLNIASLASAIVSGNSLEIIIKASENTPGLYNNFPRVMGIDDITVSSITYLYSISSGNWDSPSTWSAFGYSGAPYTSLPNQNTHVFIGSNKNVTLNGIAESAGLTVESSGRLNYTANGQLKILRGGKLAVKNGGEISKNGNVGTTLSLATYSYSLEIDGILSVDNINVNAANVTFGGAGNIQIQSNLSINNVVSKTLINNNTGILSIGNNLIFSNTSSDLTFENNGNLKIGNYLRFNKSNVAFENNAHLSVINSILLADNTINGNSLTNAGVFDVQHIDLNMGDFTLINTGTINQTGDFLDVDTGSRFENKEESNWNFSGAGLNSRLFVNYSDNTFSYNRAGNQTIFTPADGAYYNLSFSGSGLKNAISAVNIDNDLHLSGSSQLDVSENSHNINIAGDWIEESDIQNPFNSRSGRVIFDGLGDQQMHSASGLVSFHQLELAKVTGNLILGGPPALDLRIQDKLMLTKGGLHLNGNRLSILNADNAALSRVEGYIKSEIDGAPYSPVVWSVGEGIGAYVLPFGLSENSEAYIPFTFDIKVPGAGSGAISVATYGTGQNNLPYPEQVAWLKESALVANRFWQIDLEDYLDNPAADVTFTTTPQEAETLSSMRAQRWNAMESNWDHPIEGQVNPTTNSVKVPLVNSFSPWTLVDENNILPVNLLYFKGKAQAQNVMLEWKTAQESENDYFTIERSLNMIDFHEVKRVKGNGNSSKEILYKAIDKLTSIGIVYYRLKQTDFNGLFSYSKIIAVEGFKGVKDFVLFPNPSNGTLISLKADDLSEIQSKDIQVFSMNGQEVYLDAELTISFGTLRIKFNEKLPTGMYWLHVGSQYSQKFVVSKDNR